MMYDGFIALDEQPGVRPVGFEETWHQLLAKYVLKVIVPEATHKFNDGQLCTVLKAGIDGAVHGVQSIWDTNST